MYRTITRSGGVGALAAWVALGLPVCLAAQSQSASSGSGRRHAFGYEAIVVDVQHPALSAPLFGLAPMWRFQQPGRRVNGSFGFDIAFSGAREERGVCPAQIGVCPIERVRERGNWTAMQGGADVAIWRPGRAVVAALGNALITAMGSRQKGLETDRTDSYGGVQIGAATGLEFRYPLHARWLLTSRATIGGTVPLFGNADAHADHTFNRRVAHRQFRAGLSYVPPRLRTVAVPR